MNFPVYPSTFDRYRPKIRPLMMSLIRESNNKYEVVNKIKALHDTTFEFEIGYAMFEIIDKYKSILDMHHSRCDLLKLQRTEHHANEITHLADMILLMNKTRGN